MDAIAKLLAIEEIKRLKARYFLHLDRREWDLWFSEVFAEDVVFHAPETRPDPFVDTEELRNFAAGFLEGKVSVHHGHMPIIEVTSDTTATGIWAMEDLIFRKEPDPSGRDIATFRGFGHYYENYRKTAKGWRIAEIRLERLRTEITTVT